VAYLGDSIVHNSVPTWPDALPTYVPAFAVTPWTINYGIAGERVSLMVTHYMTEAHVNRPVGGAVGTFLLHGGGNDLADGVAPATVYGDLSSLWASARADGYTVVALTVLPRTGGWGPSGSQAAADALNALILSDPTRYDRLVRADLVLPAPLNTAWYLDTTHPTVLGAQLLAQAVAAVLP
jgi:lysophospholipase L1-like esterase